MANTYEIISKTTVGSGGAVNIEFTSIPATYTDLVLKVSARGTGADNSILINYNSDTGANYSARYIFGDGSDDASASASANLLTTSINPSTYTSDSFSNAELYIPNYASSNDKSSSHDGVQETNATLAYMALTANLWTNSAAITSIKLSLGAGQDFAEHSTAYLYGIKNS